MLYSAIGNQGMIMNTERIKLENYNGVLYCDVCMNDEFSMNDLETIRDEIRNNFSSSADIICKRSGSYSVAIDVQKLLFKGINEFLNVVYVVDNDFKRRAAVYASETYMRKYNARVAGTKKAAYAMLTETP